MCLNLRRNQSWRVAKICIRPNVRRNQSGVESVRVQDGHARVKAYVRCLRTRLRCQQQKKLTTSETKYKCELSAYIGEYAHPLLEILSVATDRDKLVCVAFIRKVSPKG